MMEKPVNTDNGQQTVNDAEKAWLAAMIEAEGSITMSVFTRSGRTQNLRIIPRVVFTNTDHGLIERFAALLTKAGIGRHIRHTKPNNVKYGKLVNKSYKDITYVSVEGFKRVSLLLDAVTPFMFSVKKDRAEVLNKFLKQRLVYAEASGALKGNYAYRESDVHLMLDFLRLTKTVNFDRIAGMLNEHTQEAKHEHRKAMRREYYRAAAERGYVRPSRRALVSRESVRAARNEQPPA
jgi:LAGLIDADG DNA endonuclease family protein